MSHLFLAGRGSDLPVTRHPGLQAENPHPIKHQGEIPTGLDHGIRGEPGLLQVEAGKQMGGGKKAGKQMGGGKNMRKILEYLRLVELLYRRSTAGCQS